MLSSDFQLISLRFIVINPIRKWSPKEIFSRELLLECRQNWLLFEFLQLKNILLTDSNKSHFCCHLNNIFYVKISLISHRVECHWLSNQILCFLLNHNLILMFAFLCQSKSLFSLLNCFWEVAVIQQSTSFPMNHCFAVGPLGLCAASKIY